VGKGTLTLTDSVKRELYNETSPIIGNDGGDVAPSTSSKKRKTSNNVDNTNEDDDWVNVGTLGFYLEIKRRTTGAAAATETDNDLILKEFTSYSGKMFSVQPYFNDSYNPYQIRVMIPG
jgi:hypothetical protein